MTAFNPTFFDPGAVLNGVELFKGIVKRDFRSFKLAARQSQVRFMENRVKLGVVRSGTLDFFGREHTLNPSQQSNQWVRICMNRSPTGGGAASAVVPAPIPIRTTYGSFYGH